MKQKCVQQGPRKKAEMSCTCRAVYPKVSQVGARLIEILHSRHQQGPIDMSEVCMCETIDALGLAGFDKSFHSIEAINQGQRAHLLDVSQRQDKGPTNIMCTMTSCALQLRLVLGSQSLSLHNIAWCCAVLCCAVLCCAVLCCAVLCCAVLCCAVLCCAVLCCAVLCCAVLCCAVLCCAVLCSKPLSKHHQLVSLSS